MRRLDLESRIRRELEDYPSPDPMPDKLDCWGWHGRIVISRWSWFWKRIQFWRYKVVNQLVVDDWGKPPVRVKYLWRYR